MAMSGKNNFETCPTDVVHASAECVWELVMTPSLFGWIDAKVIEAPARSLMVGDRVIFAASLGLRVSWTVLALEPPHRIALDIELPFGIANQETIVLSRLDAATCRVSFN